MTTTRSAPLHDEHPDDEHPDELPTLLDPGELARAEAVYLPLVTGTFQFETKVGHSLAYLRTYASPRVVGLLAHTGHVTHAPEKRAVDTGIFMYELFAHGLDSPQGRAVIRRLNAMHHHWAIRNEDSLWVLGTFAVLGVQVVDRYAYRALTEDERQAGVDWWREVGTRMGITDIPETYAEFADAFRDYEERHLHRTQKGLALMAASWEVAMAQLPAPLRPLGRLVVGALTDEPARSALGLPRPLRLTSAAVTAAMVGRSLARRGSSPEVFVPGAPVGPYQAGYTLDQVGIGQDHRHPSAVSPAPAR